ncbi:acyl carrier protein [Sphingomonas sp. FW199]|uniref:acyl carrier protein n=1 Tax=Sphingomonas sp. FW199 TaxID=3400217 RepID=UPI003CEEC1E2
MTTVFDRVAPIVAKQLNRDVAEITPDMDLEAAGYESLDVIETIFAIEEEFGIDVNYNANIDDPASMKTVGDMVALIEQTIAAQDKG